MTAAKRAKARKLTPAQRDVRHYADVWYATTLQRSDAHSSRSRAAMLQLEQS